MFDNANISIFAGSSGRVFAERMCKFMGKPLGSSEVITFSEGNTFVRVNESVRDRDVLLVQPIGMHSNNEFVEILFWMDAFKRANAHTVTLVMPYFGYGKGDKKDEPRVSIRARVCAECMELAGADRFITMDLHAAQLQGFFKKPMDHLYAIPMLTEVAKRVGVENTVVVSPDAGYAKQARKFADVLHLPIAIGDKSRTDHTENAHVLEIIGDDERPIFVAVGDDAPDGEILGYAFCVIERYEGHNTMTDRLTLYIDDICVDEDARGKHVGTALYQHVIDFARAEGFYNVPLNVWSCNPGAQAFYEALGMKPYRIGMETIL